MKKDGTEIKYVHGYDVESGKQEFDGYVAFDQPLDLTQVAYVQYGEARISVEEE